jgi:uncharacterized protein
MPASPTSFPTLAIFAKSPVAGQVKTRLARTVGDRDALAVYQALLERTADVAGRWRGRVVVFLAGEDGHGKAGPLAAFPTQPQAAGGLGARLRAASAAVPPPLVVIGTDCPGLTIAHLERLAEALSRAPAAFGPAVDGGYWGVAIGDMRCAAACFADDLPWSQPTLLAQTRARLLEARMRSAIVDTLDDLDDSGDLAKAEAAGFAWRSSAGGAER